MKLSSGWFARLSGHDFDLAAWERAFRHPFEPYCERTPHGTESVLGLRSQNFENLHTADDVRIIAMPLIERLNGVMGVIEHVEPLRFDGVGRIDEHGQISTSFFAEIHSRARATATVTAAVHDANGNIMPARMPEKSTAQKYLEAAEQDDDIADLLVFAGRADNWFDIYKAVELAERIAGGGGKLWPFLGTSAQPCRTMRETANFYRHARAHKPNVLTTLGEARELLSFIVRTLIDAKLQ
jgi:hypothetical protein